ncbi:MAG: leucine-rich repeat domain-containing protein [Clostridia bacterium]|nr:leucine-rich repeat domain-containing protein [Clostridia bacterium]
MSKMKRFAAITAALLICAGNMGYMPESTKSIGGFTANAAEEEITSVEINETNFPDAIFRKYVTNHFDTNEDMVLSDEEIDKVITIDFGNHELCCTPGNKEKVSDLKGVEFFTSLKQLYFENNNIAEIDLSKNTELIELNCKSNDLTSLDVSANVKLTTLNCCYNDLTALDVTKNTKLKNLYCYENKITQLDVSYNPDLRNIDCSNNELTALDVSNNPLLDDLHCGYNHLTTLDLSNNTELTVLHYSENNLTSLDLSNNDKIRFLYVDRNDYPITVVDNKFDLSTLPAGFDVSKASGWENGTVEGNILTVSDTEGAVYYIYDCGNNETSQFVFYPITFVNSSATSEATTTTTTAPKTTTTTTPETITTTTTTTNIESDSTTNTTTSTTYTPAATQTTAKPIPTPIETYGTCGAQGSNVTWTYDGNGTLTISGEGKMSNWSSDESPWFNKQEIETIIIEDGITNIGSFAFRYCHSLTSITIPESVTSIDYGAFNFCDSLASITIPESVTDISPRAFSGSKWFTTQQEKNLFVIVNGILIDGTACKGDVVIPDSVKTINEEAFERCYDLTEITIPESVTSIGKEAFNSCDSLNKITIKNPDCEIYDAAETICDGYYFSLFDYFTGKIYGYKNSTAQAYAEKYNIRFVAIDETPAETTTTATTTAPEITTTTTTTTAEEEITNVEINETNFPDYLLRYYITKYIDTDTDNILSAEEIADVTKLDISVGGIRELTGIHYFKNLEDLDCSGNKLTTIDISNFTALTRLDCGKNKLTSLDVSKNTALTELYCSENQLTSLDLSNNTALAYLSCSNNQLTSLDLSNNTALAYLYCYDNQLTSLDVSNNPKLSFFTCYGNQLTSLDVSKNTALTNLGCHNNQLTSLDVSNNTALDFLNCSGNQLTSLDVSNNTALTDLYTYSNEYEIALTGKTFDLSTLPAGFDVSKASDWTNATVKGNILTVEDTSKSITYKYDCGNKTAEKFTLIPQIEETPAETTTTTAAPETTTTATTTVTTTPATTTPEEDLPQTGFSKLYNCIPVSAGALVLLGMYAVKKSKKEDEEE